MAEPNEVRREKRRGEREGGERGERERREEKERERANKGRSGGGLRLNFLLHLFGRRRQRFHLGNGKTRAFSPAAARM